MRTVTIGVGLSKLVFSVCAVDAAGQVRPGESLANYPAPSGVAADLRGIGKADE